MGGVGRTREDSAQYHSGIVWDYDRDTRHFTVRFPPTANWDYDDIGLSWEALRDEKPCLASPWQLAELHELSAPRMIPQPRGHRPRNAVWDQRKGGWIDCIGCDYNPSKLLLTCLLFVRFALQFAQPHGASQSSAQWRIQQG